MLAAEYIACSSAGAPILHANKAQESVQYTLPVCSDRLLSLTDFHAGGLFMQSDEKLTIVQSSYTVQEQDKSEIVYA